jgi:hypothetical protein
LHHETTPHAVVLLAGQYLEAGVVGREAHAVAVSRQDLIDMKQQIQRFVEGDVAAAQKIDPARAANSLQSGFDDSGIDGVGAKALQT